MSGFCRSEKKMLLKTLEIANLWIIVVGNENNTYCKIMDKISLDK